MSQRDRIVRRRARARRLADEGLSIRQIADRLGVAASTAHGYLAGERPEPAVPNAAGPQNLRAARHGAHSLQLVEPRAAELVPDVLNAHPHLDEQRDAPAVKRYALVLARLERVYTWLEQQGDAVFSDADAGAVHGVYSRLERWESQAERAEQALALSPTTRTRLGLDQVRGHALVADLERMRDAAELGRARVAEIEAGGRGDDEESAA